MFHQSGNWSAVVLLFAGLVSLFAAPTSGAQESIYYFEPPAWSPDASKIAVVSGSSVQVFDTLSGHPLHLLVGHTNTVGAVDWSPDSALLATGSADQTVRLWRAEDGQVVNTLAGHEDAVVSVTWSSDGTRLISSVFDHSPTLFVWEVKTGTLIGRHIGGTIEDAAFSPDGQRFALATPLSVHVLDGMTFDVLVGSDRVPCCANVMYTPSLKWSPDSRTFATGSLNGLITIWNASDATIVTQFQANSHYAPDSRDVDNVALSQVRAVTFSSDGRTILGVSGDGTLREWDVSTGALVQESQLAPLATAAWSPYGGRLVYLDASILAASEAATLQSADVTSAFHVVVPAPSLERLASIQAACSAQSEIAVTFAAPQAESDLDAYIAQVAVADQLPPGCAADLIAVAEALQAQRG